MVDAFWGKFIIILPSSQVSPLSLLLLIAVSILFGESRPPDILASIAAIIVLFFVYKREGIL